MCFQFRRFITNEKRKTKNEKHKSHSEYCVSRPMYTWTYSSLFPVLYLKIFILVSRHIPEHIRPRFWGARRWTPLPEWPCMPPGRGRCRWRRCCVAQPAVSAPRRTGWRGACRWECAGHSAPSPEDGSNSLVWMNDLYVNCFKKIV